MTSLPQWVSVLSIALASFRCLAQQPFLEVPRETDASNVGGWWAPLAVRQDKSFVAFNSPGQSNEDHHVMVASYMDDQWLTGLLLDEDGSPWRHTDDPGHDLPSIAVDGDGVLHVWADHHNSNWTYFISDQPEDVTNVRRSQKLQSDLALQGVVLSRLTYPIARTAPNGDIYLIVRQMLTDTTGQGVLLHWDNSNDSWRQLGVFARQEDAVVYPDDLQIDDLGRVHMIWQWASEGAGPLRHYGSYLVYDPGRGTYASVDGAPVTPPANLQTPNLFYQDLQDGETFGADDSGAGLQVAKMALDPSGRPSIAYRMRTLASGSCFEVYRVRWDGAWVDRRQISDAPQCTRATLGHTRSSTVARVYYVSDMGGMLVADSSHQWQPQALATGYWITNIAVVPRNEETDLIYAQEPYAVDMERGRLYLLEHIAGEPMQLPWNR